MTLFAMLTTPTMAAPVIENGGIIILVSSLKIETQDRCLIVIAPDAEIVRLSARLSQSARKNVVRIEDREEHSSLDTVLTPVDKHHLSGRIVTTGRQVLIVSQSYARARGWLQADFF